MPDFYTAMLQVRGNSLIAWQRAEYDYRFNSSHKSKVVQNFKGSKTYTGMMTDSTAKRIRKAVELLMQVSPARTVTNPFTKHVITHRLSFITLTIPDISKNYTPQEGYNKLLKPWLRYFKENNTIQTYIWKAELQERKQLHYHITTNSLIDWRIIRKHWNGLMTKNKMLEEYYSRFQHYDPNSTDIHQVHKLTDIQSYLVKYLSKGTQNQEATKGKIWGCSENLRGKSLYSTEMNNINERKILSAYNQKKISLIELENCTVIRCNSIKPESLLDKTQSTKWKDYLQSIRDFKTQKLL